MLIVPKLIVRRKELFLTAKEIIWSASESMIFFQIKSETWVQLKLRLSCKSVRVTWCCLGIMYVLISDIRYQLDDGKGNKIQLGAKFECD